MIYCACFCERNAMCCLGTSVAALRELIDTRKSLLRIQIRRFGTSNLPPGARRSPPGACNPPPGVRKLPFERQQPGAHRSSLRHWKAAARRSKAAIWAPSARHPALASAGKTGESEHPTGSAGDGFSACFGWENR